MLDFPNIIFKVIRECTAKSNLNNNKYFYIYVFRKSLSRLPKILIDYYIRQLNILNLNPNRNNFYLYLIRI